MNFMNKQIQAIFLGSPYTRRLSAAADKRGLCYPPDAMGSMLGQGGGSPDGRARREVPFG